MLNDNSAHASEVGQMGRARSTRMVDEALGCLTDIAGLFLLGFGLFNGLLRGVWHRW